MKAVCLAERRLEVAEVPSPTVGEGEVRIRVHLAGVCSTDIELAAGYMDFSGIPGHEFVGEVIDGPRDWLGARVVGGINASCHVCRTCRSGRDRHCPERTVLGILGRDGAHAEELTLPVANLHRVPEEIDDEVAVFVEPLAAAWRVVEQVPVAGKSVAVLGIGKLGQLIARCAALAGGDVVGIGRSLSSRALLEGAGIVALAPENVADRRFDVVVEATGDPAGLDTAIKLVAPLGVVVLKTTSHLPHTGSLTTVVVDELTLVGSRCGRFEPAIRLLATGAVDPRPLIDQKFGIEQAVDAYRRAAEPGVMKVLLEMSPG